MSRCSLHKNKLDDFKSWLVGKMITHRAGRGEYQVLQVYYRLNWHVIYKRDHMPEHLTTVRTLDPLIRQYHKERHGH